MSDQESLSDIVQFGKSTSQAEPVTKGEAAKPAEAAPPAADTKVEGVKPEAKESRDEKGRFAKGEEKPAETQETKPRADVAAIIDERRKRQAAEDRLAEVLRGQQKPIEKPSVFDNEDAAISSRVAEGNQPLREAIYKLSVKAARNLYKDFGDAENAFMEAMDKDARLVQGLRASDDPGEFIYTMGIHVRELADVGGDLMKYRDKVTAASQSKLDEQAKQLAAMTAEIATLKAAQADLESIPRSLNNATSGASPKAGDGDAESISSIVRFGNKQR